MQVEAADKGTVIIVRPNKPLSDSVYAVNKYVCITGVVQGDLSIRESTVEGFGNKFNIEIFDAVVKAKNQFSSVF